MDFDTALKQASLIMGQERIGPTVNYTYIGKTIPVNSNFYNTSQGIKDPSLAGIYALNSMRKQRPREVWERPGEWKFGSRNYGLLMLILNQLDAASKTPLLLKLIANALSSNWFESTGSSGHFPCWNSHTSELALLAEICVRNNFLPLLLESVRRLDMPNGNVAVMLIQMEEMLALNFNIFSQSELENMPAALERVRDISYAQTWESRRPRGGGTVIHNPAYKAGNSLVGAEIVSSIDAIQIQCQRALYLYVEGVLLQTRNPEIEGDKVRVITFLDTLGFNPTLRRALEEAEKEYRDDATIFELKNCFSHLRSFLETLHGDSAKAIASAAGEGPGQKWGEWLVFLRRKSIFSLQHEQFISSLYALMSDTSVHPLTADREYARLLRNVVLEYGVMFLSSLSAKGIKVS